MDLIHMNGRVYDPTLGRFLSADPTIDGMYTVAGYNRYSYVRNNPLKYTDLSGIKKWWKNITWKKVVKPELIIATVIVTGGAAAAAWGVVAGGAVGGFVGGFVGPPASGGSLGAAIGAGLCGEAYEALSAGIAKGIDHAALGNMAQRARNFAGGTLKYIVHGITQGAISAAYVSLFNDSMQKKYYSNDELITVRSEMQPMEKITSTSRVGNANKIIGLITDIIGLFKPAVSIESGLIYFRKIDTVHVERQWSDASTDIPLGREFIGKEYQAINTSGAYHPGYTYVGDGIYSRPTTLINGAPTNMMYLF